MTLSPVFRSRQATDLLKQYGIWKRMTPALNDQEQAVRTIHQDLQSLIDERFLEATPTKKAEPDSLAFLQEFFFLILFRSLFETLGFEKKRLTFYSELNFCIKGTITAADNLFDDQAKSLLPLRHSAGARFMSIMQLMCFERLTRRVCDRASDSGAIPREKIDEVLRGLLSMMCSIGELEGSEEKGAKEILPPDVMIEKVHRVRGGALFALSFVAPRILESGALADKITTANEAIARLGTAFQIVDDLTDFEFDLTRRSHNLLSSQIYTHGSAEERAEMQQLWNGQPPEDGIVEKRFAAHARSVLQVAYDEARAAFESLAALGFWFPADLSDDVVRAIVGMDGIARMEAITQ